MDHHRRHGVSAVAWACLLALEWLEWLTVALIAVRLLG